MDDDVLTALAAQDRELDDLVRDLDTAGLETPSRCTGWSVADVLLHLAQSNEMAVASVTDRWEAAVESRALRMAAARPADVEELAAVMVDIDRAGPEASRDRWQASVVAMEAAVAAADPRARVQWVAGELAARTLATTRLAEAWIHTIDVAVGLGVDVAPTDRLWHIARLAWRTVPYALAQGGHDPAGAVRFVLTGPAGEPWAFGPDDAPTTVSGAALDLCAVAGQRMAAADSGLQGEGPDAEATLRLVRTFA
ncbi:MAG TPA: maleylpyruvate isomerase family mycothiol-dependent enzyme [Iamia sp.]